MVMETTPNPEPYGPLLTRLYYTPGLSTSYSSLQRLYRNAKKTSPSIRLKDVQHFLDSQYVHSRHKRLKWKQARRKVLTLRIDNCWCGDLILCPNLKSRNSLYSNILVIIDLFSRFMWTRPLKTKGKEELSSAMESIISENKNKAPFRFWTDKGSCYFTICRFFKHTAENMAYISILYLGTEFLSLKELYKKHGIMRYSTHSNLKSVFVVRNKLSVLVSVRFYDLTQKAYSCTTVSYWLRKRK